jgi:hypothetical protein
MNTFLINQLVFLLAFFAMQIQVFSQEKSSKNNDIEEHCIDMANTMAGHYEWANFKVKTSCFRDKSLLWTRYKTCSIYYGEEFLIYIHDSSKDTYSCLTPTDYKEVDHKNKTISVYSLSEKDSLLAYIKRGLGTVLKSYFDFLYYLYPTFLGEAKIVDETFNDEDVIVTANGDRIRFLLEKSAVGKDIEEVADVIYSQYFIDPARSLLDSVYVFTKNDEGFFETHLSIYDFDFSDRRISIDSIFDFDNPKLKGYSCK